ncbi:MAG: hypothetical protein MRECE_11c017 [Mycoplasmataceae bacterium CE_OT135]|nr:MAG: hypothetical protein MRECE_11c017 [Mycoplasmataceae bacterium CE_OT135]
MVNILNDAQNWLDRTIPWGQRANITHLLIVPRSYRQLQPDFEEIYGSFPTANRCFLEVDDYLTDNLDLLDFTSLEKIDIHYQGITGLNLSNCSNLKEIDVNDNKLETVSFPTNGENLVAIRLANNNIVPQDLRRFSNFINLGSLFLGTDENGLRRGKLNLWSGSLSHLGNLESLMELDINATNIDSGWEDLHTEMLYHFTFGDKGITNAGVNKIKLDLGINEAIASNKDDYINSWKISQIDFTKEFNRYARELRAQIQQTSNSWMVSPRSNNW